jgi:hypothetical protein
VSAWGGGQLGPSGGIHPLVGAGTGYFFSRYGGYFLESSFAPLGGHALRTQAGTGIDQSRLYDFAFTGHVRIPIGNRWEPYGIVGAALLYNTYRQTAVNSAGAVVSRGISTTNFGFHTGGGFRYYVRETWGIRPELRIIVSNQTYVGVAVGIFYQFPGEFFN